MMLKPIRHRDEHTRVLQDQLVLWLREAVFTPLLLSLPDKGSGQRPTTLRDALLQGVVTYKNGQFSGSFSSPVSRELHKLGAVFDGRSKAFKMPYTALPYYLRGTVSEASSLSKDAHLAVLATLAAVAAVFGSADSGLEGGKELLPVITDLERQFQATLPESVEVSTFTEGDRQKLAAKAVEDAAEDMREAMGTALPRLRRVVEVSMAEERGVEHLDDVLEAQFRLCQGKAAFVAEGRTGRLISEFRQLRYAALGVQEYVWVTRGDERVREGHELLDRRTFAFSSPPITDRATGRRCNPGEDFGCRCSASPLLHLIEA